LLSVLLLLFVLILLLLLLSVLLLLFVLFLLVLFVFALLLLTVLLWLVLILLLFRMVLLFIRLLRVGRSRDPEKQRQSRCVDDSDGFHRYSLHCCWLHEWPYCKLPVVVGLPIASPETSSSTLRFC
jgi:hypothetical protein